MIMISLKKRKNELIASSHISNMRGILIIIMAILTFSAVAAGALMMSDPIGRQTGLKPEWLLGTPFGDYWWPGALLILFITLPGILSMIMVRSGSPNAFSISFTFSLIAIFWFVLQLLLIPEYAGISLFYLILSVMGILCSMQLMGKRAL